MNRFTTEGTNESRTAWREATGRKQDGSARRTFLKSMGLVGMMGFAGCTQVAIEPNDESDIVSTEAPDEPDAVPTETDDDSDVVPAETMTLVVDVPTNTFEEDIVLIPLRREEYLAAGDMEPIFKQMKKVGNYTFTVELTREEIALERPDIFNYAYFRGWGHTFPAGVGESGVGEVIPSDEWEEPWGRRTVFEGGKVQRDVVEQWRWFPEGPLQEDDLNRLEMPDTFQDRVDGMEFRMNMFLPDLFMPYHELFYAPTAEQLQEMGANWVTIAPAWQWIADDPPQLGNVQILGTEGILGPDEQLHLQIREFKEEGFEVLILPQIYGGVDISFEDRSEDWWEQYYSEVERAMLYHARLAEEEGADAISVFIRREEFEGEIDPAASWRSIAANLRSEFSGEIGLGIDFSEHEPWLTFGDEFDYIHIAWEGKQPMLSPEDDPGMEELVDTAGELLDKYEWLYDEFGKPVVIWEVYPSVKQVWKGGRYLDELEEEGCIPELWDEDDCDVFSGMDQAITLHAVMLAIEERPWVVGLSHQDYDLIATPLYPAWSIRGKPAEDLLNEWSQLISDEEEG